jgi:HPt (histidine-containing phosphotransfer) domain-containing protein
MNPPAKTINLEFLLNFTKGDNEKTRRYINMYLSTTPKVIDEMEFFLTENKLDSLRLKAHSIKPQVQYMGVSNLSNVLLKIEEICNENLNIENLPDLVSEAKRLNRQATKELNQFLEQI